MKKVIEMYKRILVPVALDHEHCAEDALTIAQQLRNPDGRVTALHVMEEIPRFVLSYLPSDVSEKTEKQSSEDLARLVKKVDGDFAQITLWGRSHRAILEYAEANDIDCIVIASHKPGIDDYFLGSTAARVVRHARCSVHVVR